MRDMLTAHFLVIDRVESPLAVSRALLLVL